MAFVLQLVAALVGALVGAGVGAYLAYRYATRIEDRRLNIANLQHHATHLSEALRTVAALGVELGANAAASGDRLEDLGKTPPHPRPLRPRTAVWDGRAADVAHLVHELTPDEHDTVETFYAALAAFDAELERAFRLEIDGHGYGRGTAMEEALESALATARARGQEAVVLGIATVASVVAVRKRLTERARQMAEISQELYKGTPFAEGLPDLAGGPANEPEGCGRHLWPRWWQRCRLPVGHESPHLA